MPRGLDIAGGGLAGLALGVALRRRGVRVTLWEAGHYPRHRVCGEFISGRGREILSRQGLLGAIPADQVRAATTAAFFTPGRAVLERPLPEPALCVSRWVLDQSLAREFLRLGGELRAGERWAQGWGEGVVRATGRRPRSAAPGYRWFGMKAHARDVRLSADLEMHFNAQGYVGLCRLADGGVNVCGLFRSDAAVPNLGARWRAWLGGPEGSVLSGRLAAARWEEGSFTSVAALSPGHADPPPPGECRVGDALSMIPPVTGNGMSMALESAEIAVEPLTAFCCGNIGWPEALARIRGASERSFRRRLRWARWLQAALFSPLGRTALLALAVRSDPFWRLAFDRTR